MNLLLESWKNFKDGKVVFNFTESEVQALNKSIAKIVNLAAGKFSAAGPTPDLFSILEIRDDEYEPSRKIAESEITKLRQKYYGSRGHVEKYGPKVRKLHKPIGDMSVEDFENKRYVLKISQTTLDDFERLVLELSKMDEVYTGAKNWYWELQRMTVDASENDAEAALFGLLIAVFSPQSPFALNLVEAAFMFKAIKVDAIAHRQLLREFANSFPGKGGTGFRSWQKNKVSNFALNIIKPDLAGTRDEKTGEFIYNDLYEWNVTVDTWIIDALYPNLKMVSTQSEWKDLKSKLMSEISSYRYMSLIVAKEARKFNLAPHELQAIIWVASQARRRGASELGTTVAESYRQISEAIENTAKLRTKLETYKDEMKQQGAIATVLDEIDRVGFKSAATIALGAKDESGKTTTSGVRSIVSKTPKGYHKYYEPRSKSRLKAEKIKEGKQPLSHKSSHFSKLKSFYVLNGVIQMPTGKFGSLHDVILLYLEPGFSTDRAVEFILGRFNQRATSTGKEYLKEAALSWLRQNQILD